MKWIFKAAILAAIAISTYAEASDKPILYESEPYLSALTGPNEQRDPRYVPLLSMSVKIHVSGASGSGTICNFDRSSGVAHVISCGHLWSGNKKYDPKEARPKAKIVVWYKNSEKLPSPESFDAEVLFWSNERGYDVSLIRFKPDWIPQFAAIEKNFSPTKGMVLNSMGCDGGGEVARYEVVFSEYAAPDLITKKNSPRPGRSGGGLINDDGRLVGVCWGTSDVSSGNGIGYFTPVKSIRKVFESNGHGWLLDVLRSNPIPIVDRENKGAVYPLDFVPIPLKF
jgi:hypothetical protein